VKTAYEIQLETQVATLEAQLIAIDDRLGREGDGLLRRYEIALREIAAFSVTGTEDDVRAWGRASTSIAKRALVETVLPKKRCQSPTCVLSRGHGEQHFDGVQSWGKTRPIRKPLTEAESASVANLASFSTRRFP
jgi:hypothetical protein